jgi:hypothetical protein
MALIAWQIIGVDIAPIQPKWCLADLLVSRHPQTLTPPLPQDPAKLPLRNR